MADAVIDNPILNAPFGEPSRHWRFGDTGITNEIVEGRRLSSYFMPIPASKVRGRQLELETQWTRDRIEENRLINQIRGRVTAWRALDWPGVTPTTRRLLEYWKDRARERPLFFCQVEALETAIYLTECATKQGDAWIGNELRRLADDQNPGLYRMAFKMATGSGKTVVMAMVIAWHALNKQANSKDARFSDAFLIVTPGITIRDRLRVLLPEDPGNYYRARDVVPSADIERLRQARIVITNFHSFLPREAQVASKTTKELLTRGGENPFVETPDRMVRRVCRGLGTKRQIIVLNDEAHHCYMHRVGGEEETLKGDERKEAERRDREARVWASGLQAVARKLGVKVVYDLSATPFFLRGSGWPEGTLFGWVVSDFSLIDAIEAGIVKIPRVPVADDVVDKAGRPSGTCGRRSAQSSRRGGRRTRRSPSRRGSRRSFRRRCTPCTATTRRPTGPGRSGNARSRVGRPRPCLSWSATTRVSPSSSTTTLPAGRSPSTTAAASWCPASCRSSPTRKAARSDIARGRSLSIRSSLSRGRG